MTLKRMSDIEALELLVAAVSLVCSEDFEAETCEEIALQVLLTELGYIEQIED